jgi:protein TonB
VNERGLAGDVQVRTSSGSERLDATAQDTVRHWKFVPARRGEMPVGAWVLVPISFSLRSSS